MGDSASFLPLLTSLFQFVIILVMLQLVCMDYLQELFLIDVPLTNLLSYNVLILAASIILKLAYIVDN